ncbi:tyrosine-type recombinase/integrase [Saccharopolyspora sp. 5N102]|uniref:tyrosine-type recombinase/integrase n=1 Tax=Saccharopolyspora sp. 5N102 TaxID=3375155 RepID=UPI0037B72493
MAWPEKLPSGRYRGAFRDRRGRQRYVKGTYTQAAEATRQAAIEEDKYRQRGTVSAEAGRTTVELWVKEWWPKRKVEPGTLGRDESRLNVHILPHWGVVELSEIEQEDVQEWVDELVALKDEKNNPLLAPATVHRIYAVFSAMMKAAVGKKIAVSPCAGIDLPIIPPADEYFLERDEYTQLLNVTPNLRARVFLELKVGTGMRWGEIIALHRHRVHLQHLRIDIFDAFDSESGEIVPYPKGKRKRSVPITQELADLLAEWFQKPELPCATPHRKLRRRQGECRSGLVVPSSTGTVLHYSNFRRDVWNPIVKATGLVGVTPHDLRHTYASWLVQDRVSIKALSVLLGHASVATTERYAHLADTQWDQVRAVLGQAPEISKSQHADPEPAPYLPHENDSAAGAEIIDLFSRRRSAG